MDFASLIIFLTLYYIRPQEWILSIQPLKPVTLSMVFAIIAVFSRPGGFSKKELFRTPHDWLIAIYCAWMVLASPNKMETFHSVYPLYLCYAVAVQAFYSIERIRRFLFWWAIMIFVLSGFAVLSEYGFDPTNAYDITHGSMKNRLIINTSLFNNPNALGHSCVPVVLMIYFLLVWKRPIFVRIGAIPLFALPLYCIYLTQSKGSFISAFGSIIAALIFGRPKFVQVLIIIFAVTMGWAAVKTLPRMQEIDKTKNDQAIQGRVKAWHFGFDTFNNSIAGIGKDNFVQCMTETTGIRKAAHSSYVEIGCELGKPGFFLFVAILFSCLRTLFTSEARNTEEERVQRILYSMIISYMISSWMVDFAYRMYFFLFVAAIASYHRLLMKQENPERAEDEETAEEALSAIPTLAMLGPKPAMAGPERINQVITQTTITVPAGNGLLPEEPTEEGKEQPPGITWNRFSWLDYVAVLVMMYAMYRIWEYALRHV